MPSLLCRSNKWLSCKPTLGTDISLYSNNYLTTHFLLPIQVDLPSHALMGILSGFYRYHRKVFLFSLYYLKDRKPL
jgi:hypothetical protein